MVEVVLSSLRGTFHKCVHNLSRCVHTACSMLIAAGVYVNKPSSLLVGNMIFSTSAYDKRQAVCVAAYKFVMVYCFFSISSAWIFVTVRTFKRLV